MIARRAVVVTLGGAPFSPPLLARAGAVIE
jgi:hypothetical protein